MSLSNHEQGRLALLDALTGLEWPAAIHDTNGDRIVTSEHVTWLLDTAPTEALHALAAVITAARRSHPPGPW